jgi:hypothetical protein
MDHEPSASRSSSLRIPLASRKSPNAFACIWSGSWPICLIVFEFEESSQYYAVVR